MFDTSAFDTSAFDTVAGLPLHPLVVHAVVVLVPLAALGVVVMAASPMWFERLRWPVLLVLGAGAASAVVARLSGQQFLKRLGVSGSAVQRHVDLGGWAPWVVGLAFVATAGWVSAVGPAGGPGRARATTVTRVLAVLAVVTALLATGYLVLVGHSGATAVWGSVG